MVHSEEWRSDQELIELAYDIVKEAPVESGSSVSSVRLHVSYRRKETFELTKSQAPHEEFGVYPNSGK